jgi:hypothetical protein
MDANRILPDKEHPWMEAKSKLTARLINLCKRNNIYYVPIDNLNAESIKKSPTEKMFSFLLYDLLYPYDKWKILDDICCIENKKIWIVTDNIVDLNVYQFKNIQIKSYHELLGMSYYGEIINDVPPNKLYNCFIQRCESTRQSWLYFLYLNNLLDKGYVSYLLWQLDSYSQLRGAELFDFIHYNFKLDQLESFNRAYNELKIHVPYRNFSKDDELIKLIADSKYSLILETYATDDIGAWCITEKLMRSLQSNSITLGFSQKHTFNKLSELDIEVDNFLKEIDNLNWIDRQQALLKILVEDSIDINLQIKNNQSRHNSNLLLKWKTQYQQANFFDELFDEIKTA